DGNIDWIGWKYLDVAIDSGWHLPIKLEQIYAVEVDKAYRGRSTCKGVIYVDHIRFVYLDDKDLKGPVFSDIHPVQDYVYKDAFTFRAKVTDEMSGVQSDSIYVHVNGEKVDHSFCREKQTITCRFRNIKEGSYHISVMAEDYAGNMSKNGIEKTIIVDPSPDIEGPVISNITPTETTTVYTHTPRITFHLTDVKSGVDKKNIAVKLNG